MWGRPLAKGTCTIPLTEHWFRHQEDLIVLYIMLGSFVICRPYIFSIPWSSFEMRSWTIAVISIPQKNTVYIFWSTWPPCPMSNDSCFVCGLKKATLSIVCLSSKFRMWFLILVLVFTQKSNVVCSVGGSALWPQFLALWTVLSLGKKGTVHRESHLSHANRVVPAHCAVMPHVTWPAWFGGLCLPHNFLIFSCMDPEIPN